VHEPEAFRVGGQLADALHHLVGRERLAVAVLVQREGGIAESGELLGDVLGVLVEARALV
jgi:hypothetical protein